MSDLLWVASFKLRARLCVSTCVCLLLSTAGPVLASNCFYILLCRSAEGSFASRILPYEDIIMTHARTQCCVVCIQFCTLIGRFLLASVLLTPVLVMETDS